MNYADYKGYNKAYVLVHNTGTGTMEDNYIERGVVYETDDYDDAKRRALELKIANNSFEQIEAGWCDNVYEINVNTLSEKGKELSLQFDKVFSDMLSKSTYVTSVNSMKYHFTNGIIDKDWLFKPNATNPSVDA